MPGCLGCDLSPQSHSTWTGQFEPLPCNAFAYCPEDVCFEPDAHKHSKVSPHSMTELLRLFSACISVLMIDANVSCTQHDLCGVAGRLLAEVHRRSSVTRGAEVCHAKCWPSGCYFGELMYPQTVLCQPIPAAATCSAQGLVLCRSTSEERYGLSNAPATPRRRRWCSGNPVYCCPGG
jgi:hypothetical protein